MSTAQAIILAALMLLGGGIALLVREILRPRLGFDPYCRKCNYNLRGRERLDPFCPECGADLDVDGSVMTGRLDRRPHLIWTAIILIVCGGAPIVVPVVRELGLIDTRQFTPFWALKLDVACGDPSMELDTAFEFQRRLTAGSLSNEQKFELAEVAMNLGGGRSAQTRKIWQAIFQSLWNAGMVRDAALREHLQQTIAAELIFPRRVRDGEPIPFGFRYKQVAPTIDPSVGVCEQSAVLVVHSEDAKDHARLEAQPVRVAPFLLRNLNPSMPPNTFCIEPAGYRNHLMIGRNTVRGEVLLAVKGARGNTVTVPLECENGLVLAAASDAELRAAERKMPEVTPSLVEGESSSSLLLHANLDFDLPVDVSIQLDGAVLPLGRCVIACSNRRGDLQLGNDVAQRLKAVTSDSVSLMIVPRVDEQAKMLEANPPYRGCAYTTLWLRPPTTVLRSRPVAAEPLRSSYAGNARATKFPTVDLTPKRVEDLPITTTVPAPRLPDSPSGHQPGIARGAPDWSPPWIADSRVGRLPAVMVLPVELQRGVIDVAADGSCRVVMDVGVVQDANPEVLIRSHNREVGIGRADVDPARTSISLPIPRSSAAEIVSWQQDTVTLVVRCGDQESKRLLETRPPTREALARFAGVNHRGK